MTSAREWHRDRERQIRDALPLLLELDQLACDAACTYTIKGGDSGNFDWDVSVDSVAPAERFIGKSTSELSWGLQKAIDHLKKLGAKS